MSSRIYAFHTLFSQKLPESKPGFLSDADWAELVDLVATGKLVSIVEFREGRLSVRLPIGYDIIIHSLANYGPALTEHTTSASTRFRWWTDSSIPQLKVSNRKVNNVVVERSIQLPDSIVAHPYLQTLFRNDRFAELCSELMDFFNALLKCFLHPDDYANFEDGQFGRSRKRPRLLADCGTAMESIMSTHLQRWDEMLRR